MCYCSAKGRRKEIYQMSIIEIWYNLCLYTKMPISHTWHKILPDRTVFIIYSTQTRCKSRNISRIWMSFVYVMKYLLIWHTCHMSWPQHPFPCLLNMNVVLLSYMYYIIIRISDILKGFSCFYVMAFCSWQLAFGNWQSAKNPTFTFVVFCTNWQLACLFEISIAYSLQQKQTSVLLICIQIRHDLRQNVNFLIFISIKSSPAATNTLYTEQDLTEIPSHYFQHFILS